MSRDDCITILKYKYKDTFNYRVSWTDYNTYDYLDKITEITIYDKMLVVSTFYHSKIFDTYDDAFKEAEEIDDFNSSTEYGITDIFINNEFPNEIDYKEAEIYLKGYYDGEEAGIRSMKEHYEKESRENLSNL